MPVQEDYFITNVRKILYLIPELQRKVEKYVDSLIDDLGRDLMKIPQNGGNEMVKEAQADYERREKGTQSGKLKQNWAGALSKYRDKFTSLDLQKKALEWRGD